MVLSLVLIEAGARVLYWAWDSGLSDYLDPYTLSDHLDGYEQVDPNNPKNWILRPDTDWRLEDLIDAKESRGATLGAGWLRTLQVKYGLEPGEVVMRVNRHGFKGPELDEQHRKPRILALGDSCTFGTWLDRSSYPRTLARQLQNTVTSVEVINGGVEGYTSRNIRYRLPELLALEPEIVTLYLGWNSLYSQRLTNQHPLRTVRLLRTLYRVFTSAPATMLGPMQPDPKSEELEWIGNVDFPDIDDFVAIGDSFAAAGSQVIVLTLPGLFTTGQTPSPASLEMGHLPLYTRNPYTLALLTENYNKKLRKIAAIRGWRLIDLERWSQQTLKPRDQYFFDSVHLVSEGQELIGTYLAEQPEPLLVD